MKKNKHAQDVKTDLKHDSMEFAAPADGEDILDTDDAAYEEAEIDAAELDALEDDTDNEAAALNATEIDLLADEDILPEEDWTDDLPDNETDEEGQDKHHRN